MKIELTQESIAILKECHALAGFEFRFDREAIEDLVAIAIKQDLARRHRIQYMSALFLEDKEEILKPS